MSTPHIQAEVGQIAKTVIMPGDPLRAKMIAENFLENPVLINEVRGMLGYTGTYKGALVTVMGSGMGMPSIGIYSYELFTVFGVENIIRVGSCGSYVEELDLNDVVLAESAWSESSFALAQNGCEDHTIYPSAALNEKITEAAKERGKTLTTVKVHSSDVFYHSDDNNYLDTVVGVEGCSVVEMESFALFHNANVTGKNAACLLTISDSFVKPGILTAEERQNSMTNMIEIALESCLK